MKNAIALIAVAGLAGAASAQSLNISSTATTLDTSGGDVVFTISISANADFAGEAINGAIIGLGASGDNAGVATNGIAINHPGWGTPTFNTDAGGDGNDGHNGMGFGQLGGILPTAPDSLLSAAPVDLGSFQITVAAGSEGTLSYSLTQPNQNLFIETYDSNLAAPGTTQFQLSQIDVGGITVNFVPAPSALAMLGLGGLVAGRRRR